MKEMKDPTEAGKVWVKETLLAIQTLMAERTNGVDMDEMGIHTVETVRAQVTPIPSGSEIPSRFLSTGYQLSIDFIHNSIEVGHEVFVAASLEEGY